MGSWGISIYSSVRKICCFEWCKEMIPQQNWASDQGHDKTKSSRRNHRHYLSTVLILMTKNSKIWALLSFHNYSNDFYLLLHLHFSQRQKKKGKKRKQEMRRWHRRGVVHRKERKEKRDWGERNRRQLLELWPLLHSYWAESAWCTYNVSGQSAGEEQKGGGIEVRWPSCTCPVSLPSVKILLETLYFFMIIMSEVYIILLILCNCIYSFKRIQ